MNQNLEKISESYIKTKVEKISEDYSITKVERIKRESDRKFKNYFFSIKSTNDFTAELKYPLIFSSFNFKFSY